MPSDTVQAERHIKFRILASTLIAFGLLALAAAALRFAILEQHALNP